MVFGFFMIARVIKLPIRIRGRGRIRRRGGRSRIFRPFRTRVRLGETGVLRLLEKVRRSAYRAIDLVAPQDKTEREKYARKQQHQHEQADDMPAFEHTLSGAPSFSSRSHSYFCGPPKFLVHWLMISIGSGNTIVVFFSTPISVRVCR